MRVLKILHLASFDGNIGDNANHDGFYTHLKQLTEFEFKIEQLEIREYYWKKRFFDASFVELANKYDLLIIGGGNYFELWVEGSPTGTSISIELDLLREINTPILFNALGVDPGQGASEANIQKFRNFLDLLIERNDFISIRNDGAKENVIQYVGEKYLKHIYHTIDAGFFADISEPSEYYSSKKYIAINVAYDMQGIRFENISYKEFLNTFKVFINKFLEINTEFEIVLVPHIFRDMVFIADLLNVLDDEIRRRKVSVGPLLHGQNSHKEVMSIYKGAQVVLANRFHANVCSIGIGVPAKDLIHDFGFRLSDLEAYFPVSPYDLQKTGTTVHYLGYYVKWHPQETYYYSVENSDFMPNDHRTEGSFSKYSSLDDKIDWLHYHTTMIKFGIGRATYDSAQEIRNGDITRDEGVALIKRFDGEFPEQYIQDCCNYMDITLDRYHDVIEKFRTPHLWEQRYGKWELKKPIWKEDK